MVRNKRIKSPTTAAGAVALLLVGTIVPVCASALETLTFDAQPIGPVTGPFTEGSFTVTAGSPAACGFDDDATIVSKFGSKFIENIPPGCVLINITAIGGGEFTLKELDLVGDPTFVRGLNGGLSQWSAVVGGTAVPSTIFGPAPATPIDELWIVLGGGGAATNVESADNIVLECQDTDGDCVADTVDNCPSAYNPSQENLDSDSEGDVCDVDDDNDGIPDTADNCPIDANPFQEDFDVDGLGNACDTTFGGDAIIDSAQAGVSAMIGSIVNANPSGGNGMIKKLTGNGGVLPKLANAVNAFGIGLIDIDTYVSELQTALDKLTAFDNQLAAKSGSGEGKIGEPDATDLATKTGELRSLIESLIAAVGG